MNRILSLSVMHAKNYIIYYNKNFIIRYCLIEKYEFM